MNQVDFNDVLELVKVIQKYGDFLVTSDIIDTVFESPETHIPNWEERRPRAQRAWRLIEKHFFNTGFINCVMKKPLRVGADRTVTGYMFSEGAIPWLQNYANQLQFALF